MTNEQLAILITDYFVTRYMLEEDYKTTKKQLLKELKHNNKAELLTWHDYFNGTDKDKTEILILEELKSRIVN